VCVRCTLLQPENNSMQRVQLGSRYFHGNGIKARILDKGAEDEQKDWTLSFFSVMKIRTDPLSPKCREEETAYHFLGRSSAMMLARYSILRSCSIDIMELQQVQPYTLLRFAKASKRFI